MLISIFISADQTKPTKSCSIYFISIKYSSGRFLTFSVMPCLHEINNKKKKKENSSSIIACFPIDDH